jgi:hypothetical protein
MPNWVYNNVSVVGDKKRVTEFRKKHFTSEKDQVDGLEGREEFDFETIIPMPETVFRGNIGAEERKQHGNNNWYDWSIENWGCKWNAGNTQLYSDKIRVNKGVAVLEFSFDTAWSLPEPVYEKLAEMYPDLSITVSFDEESGAFSGEIEMKKGEMEYYNDLRMSEMGEE